MMLRVLCISLHAKTCCRPKPLGSQILYEASMGKGNLYVYNNPGHMTKMAAMPIYGKIHVKSTGLISTKLDMKHRGLK